MGIESNKHEIVLKSFLRGTEQFGCGDNRDDKKFGIALHTQESLMGYPKYISKDKTDSFRTLTRLKWTVIGRCFVAVAVECLVILLSLVTRWFIPRNKVFENSEKTVYVICDDLKWSGNTNLEGFQIKNESDTDNVTCCNLISKVLDKLIEKHTISKHDELQSSRIICSLGDECAGETLNPQKPYVKMTGLNFTEMENGIIGSLGDECAGETLNPQKPYVKMTGLNFTEMENDEDNLIRWNSTKYECKVNPIDGKIFIQDPGLYYVFSNLKVNIPETNSRLAHSHYVYVQSYSRGTLKPILENSKVLCETTSSTNEIVSTIGAIFQLEKHDKLFVRSSHPQHLVSSEYSNEFGL